MADSTSRVAASMLRLRSNCSVTLTWPKVLCEVISITEEMRPNSRSSGVAMDDAMISGLAPGSCADTDTVGKSTCGRGDTGSTRKAAAPDNTTAAVRSVVAMGRLMNGADRFMARPTFAAREVRAGAAEAPGAACDPGRAKAQRG